MDQNQFYAQQQQAFFMQQAMLQQQQLQHQQQLQQQQAQAQGLPPPFNGYAMAGIDYPGMNDVMCGRGGGTNNHIGNIRFRQLVNEHKLRYLAAPKVDKPKVAMDVVQIWRRLDPPGRFLTKTDASQGDDSLWHDVGDKKAREKASQCLRERTPDVLPFVKKLKEQEEERKRKEAEKKEAGKVAKDGKKKDGKEKADAVTSGETSENSKPDQTVSMPQPDATPSSGAKEGKKKDIAEYIPVAAALMEDVFDNEEEEDALSYEAYQAQMQEFLDSVKDNDEISVTDRSLLMDAMSTNSKDWMKSFQSVGSVGGASNMMMSITNSSLRDVVGETEIGEMPPPENVPRPHLSKDTRSQKLKAAANNNISMLSDLTDMSSLRNKSTRSGKTQTSRLASNRSMMSELTDLSEGLKEMGLKQDK